MAFLEKFGTNFCVSFSDFQNFGFLSLTPGLSPFSTKIDQMLLADKYKAGSIFFEALETQTEIFCNQINIVFVSFGSF